MTISHAMVASLALGGALILCGCPASDDSDSSDTIVTMPTTVDPTMTMTDTDPTTMTMPTTMGTTMDSSTTAADCTETELSHATDIQPIWNDSCTQDAVGGCHEPGGTWQFLDLTDGVAYDAIFENVAVHTQSTGVFLVDPGSKEDSYLWHKIVGTPTEVAGGCCEPMPNMNETLPQAQIDMIGEWIDCGAPP